MKPHIIIVSHVNNKESIFALVTYPMKAVPYICPVTSH